MVERTLTEQTAAEPDEPSATVESHKKGVVVEEDDDVEHMEHRPVAVVSRTGSC